MFISDRLHSKNIHIQVSIAGPHTIIPATPSRGLNKTSLPLLFYILGTSSWKTDLKILFLFEGPQVVQLQDKFALAR